MFHRTKKVIQGWNDMSVSKAWQNFHFCLDYPFKVPAKSWPEVETPRGKPSLLKMPVCSFMTLNPEDRIPFMNLSSSQLWFEQYSQSISDLLHYWWPSLFYPMLGFFPQKQVSRRDPSPAQARQHFYADFWDACLACWYSQNFLYLICLYSLPHTTCSKTLGRSHRCTAVYE